MRTIKLTSPEAKHLLTLLQERLVEGSYYGNQVHYYARTRRLIAKLEDLLSDPVPEDKEE